MYKTKRRAVIALRFYAWILLLLNQLANGSCGAAGSVGLVGVDVHGGIAAFAYTDLNVVEDQASVLGVDLDLNNLAVAYASLFGLSGADVQVTFCNDDAFRNLYFTGRADQLAGSAAL